ncbi:LysR family transcriptional regulator [Aeromonas sp. s3]|uniref:LysR family transcriptional regulator n=1 Tax=Aeromonas TaxID=642 RepID=UPI00288C87F0|nr:LysR family transcriptional regulator [Aeromonas dhakensis]
MDKWTEYEVFVQVVELGSISKAADTLGLSNPAASRHLAALEQRLNARLVERTTRRLFVTEIGEHFYTRCKTALNEMREAIDEVNIKTGMPTGILKLTASLSLMLNVISPLIPKFMAKYPGIQVELIANNRYLDIIENNIDISIRSREVEPDSSLVIQPLAVAPRILAASPEYIERYGDPQTPHDLTKHQLLLYSHHNPKELTMMNGSIKLRVPTTPTIESNDAQILLANARNGMGILAQPVYAIYDELRSQRLKPVLTDWRLADLSIGMAYANRLFIPSKTRVFIEFIKEEFQQFDYEQCWREALSC